MKNVVLKIWQLLCSNAFQVALTFLLSGFLAGAIFTLLTRSPVLENFFFAPVVGIFRQEARFTWYLVFSSFLSLGVAVAFLVSSRRINFAQKFQLTAKRSFLALFIVSASIPLSYLLCVAAFSSVNVLLMWLVVPLLLITMSSLAACIVTRSFRLLSVALLANFVSLIAALGFHLLTFWLLREQGIFVIEFFEWAGLFSSLSLSFGLLLAWKARGK